LLNALLGEDRVIVTPLPGTTRDVIEESISLDGLPAVLWDTAGIRDSDDQIERIGVDLSRQHISKADAVLVVLDGSQPLSVGDQTLLADLAPKKMLIAINKSDLPPQLAAGNLAGLTESSFIRSVSAKTGDGILGLKKCLRGLLVDADLQAPTVITNLRHRSALDSSVISLSRAAASLGESYAPEFVAMDLNEARMALEEITGIIQNDDILERIFAKFCIGK
jgi:tRNA modification GTPase